MAEVEHGLLRLRDVLTAGAPCQSKRLLGAIDRHILYRTCLEEFGGGGLHHDAVDVVCGMM